MSKKKNKSFQRHFRKFHSKKTTGHPQYVYDEDGKVYRIIGITGTSITNGETNIPLDKNPEPGNSKQAYLRPTPDTIDKGVRNYKLNGWKFSSTDKKKVDAVLAKGAKKKSRKK